MNNTVPRRLSHCGTWSASAGSGTEVHPRCTSVGWRAAVTGGPAFLWARRRPRRTGSIACTHTSEPWAGVDAVCASRRGRGAGEGGGQGRVRTGDLSLFRRTLLPAELPGREPVARSSRTDEHRSGDTPDGCITALATPTGLEPATSAVTGRRANQLRYGALMALLAAPSPGARETIAHRTGWLEIVPGRAPAGAAGRLRARRPRSSAAPQRAAPLTAM